VDGLLGNSTDKDNKSFLGSIWDFLTEVDPERRALIEAEKEALKQRRLQGDEFGNTPNAWLYNSEFSDDPNKAIRFFKNIVPNAARFYTDTSDMLQIPQDVIKPVGDLVAGGILKTPVGGLLGEDVGVEQRQMATQFGNMVVDTFSSWDNFTNAVANNPLDAMGMLMGAGYGGAQIAQLAKNPALKASVKKTLQNFPDPADVMGNAPLIGQFFPNTKIPVIYWHGSDQKFTRFDTKYMGRGQGAQTYGWGIYVGQHHRTGRAYEGEDQWYDDQALGHYNNAIDAEDYFAAEMWEAALLYDSPSQVKAAMIDAYGADHPQVKKLFSEKDGDFDTFKENFFNANFGRMKVDVDEKDLATMLNDSKAVYDQPQVVKDFLSKEYPRYMELVEQYKPLQVRRDEIMDLFQQQTGKVKIDDIVLKAELDDIIKQQSDLLTRIGRLDDSIPHPLEGQNIYNWLVNRQATTMGDPTGARKIVSQKLHLNGVKGRRYWDEGSRDVGVTDKTENLVLFNSNTGKILEVNDVPVAQLQGSIGVDDVPYGMQVGGQVNTQFATGQKTSRVGEEGLLQSLTRRVEGRDRADTDEMSIQDLEGRYLLTTEADRTDASGRIVRVNDIPVDTKLWGGLGYQRMLENILADKLWATDKGAMTKLNNQIEVIKAHTGQYPLLTQHLLQPTSGNFSHMTTQVMLDALKSNLSKTKKKQLDKDIRAIVPAWKTIETDNLEDAMKQMSGKENMALGKMLDRDYRNDGLTLSQAGLAVADPDLVQSAQGTIKYIGEIEPSLVNRIVTDHAHPSYDTVLRGHTIGKLKEDLTLWDVLHGGASRYKKPRVVDPDNPTPDDWYSLKRNKPTWSLVDEGLLRNLENRGKLKGGLLK
jgi:hypothetical protein